MKRATANLVDHSVVAIVTRRSRGGKSPATMMSRDTATRRPPRVPATAHPTTGAGKTRNAKNRNARTRNAKTRNAKTRNAKTRNAKTRNAKTRNAKTRNAKTRNAKTGAKIRGAKASAMTSGRTATIAMLPGAVRTASRMISSA
jgi:hypothetical protein